MSNVVLRALKNSISGEVCIPGDKSISHRAVMLGSIAKGTTTVHNFLDGEDCLRTIDIFRHFGVSIEQEGTNVTIQSKGYEQFDEPKVPLYFGNSGTTARLMFGILPALPFYCSMYGDPHLTVRPMDRVIDPLTTMGAKVSGRNGGTYLPLSTNGTQLSGIHYKLPVKSAQVKSAVLLGGLFANGETTVVEQVKTRDHTENMLAAFGADISVDDLSVRVTNKQKLVGRDVIVPGDISSASFLLVAAAIVPGSKLILSDVGLNETRTGIIDVLINMGANISITNERMSSGERLGDIHIEQTPLKGTVIEGDLIPRLIDEIPIISLLATQAEGETIIRDAAELRVKETDRIKAVMEVLTTLGANVTEKPDGIVVRGKTALKGGSIKSYHDHRMAMLGVVASFICENEVTIDEVDSIAISYPTFFEHIKEITE